MILAYLGPKLHNEHWPDLSKTQICLLRFKKLITVQILINRISRLMKFRKYGSDMPEPDNDIETKIVSSYLDLFLFFTLSGVFSLLSE